MGLTKIKKGLDVPISGDPEQVIYESKAPKKVALIGYDYVGMKPRFEVAVGDRVKLGQLLFTDKKMPAVKYTSPGSGKIVAINRGPKRVFESIVIELAGSGEVTFKSYDEKKLKDLGADQVRTLLIDSGLWTALRARPFGKVADPEASPHSIFVTAVDTNPHAPDIETTLQQKEKDFSNGLVVISRLTEGKLFLCKAAGAAIPAAELNSLAVEEFSGPHPAGNVGTHIHFLDPVHRGKAVWHINAQDVAAVGKLFTTGKIPVERIVSLAGPAVKKPRLLKTRIGASIADLTEGEIDDGEIRLISGSVLSGRIAAGTVEFLGRYHQQISALAEGKKRRFFGWLSPGLRFFSLKRILLANWLPKKNYEFTTNLHGGHRAVYPIGSYEQVMPLDILPTFLLRSLMVDDIEEAEKLGCLELVEEDLALCTFASPAKEEYGEALRRNLTTIEKEG
jgi:Na+-transporting NADH:ubiquinone oxidoreductase subunit A